MANIISNPEQQKIVTITGGTSGIGAATAELFLNNGHKVYILSRSPIPKTQSLTTISSAHFVPCDVRSESQVQKAFKTIGNENDGIDISINCSGILEQQSSVELSLDVFENVIKTNLTGTWLCMKYQVPEMRKKQAGSIVNISSIFGFMGAPFNCAYSASKHGIIGLTKTFAVEYSDENIRFNCVAPSFTETPMLDQALSTSDNKKNKLLNMLPQNTFLSTSDVAESVYWLANDSPAAINGHCLVIDNGYTV